MSSMKKSYLTITDMFCGAGGSSQGAMAAGYEVVMAMNHWSLAVETHNSNFPQTNHDVADVTQRQPAYYPSTDVLIASPECPQHSLSNGKSKTAARSQTGLFEWAVPTDDPAAVRSRATMHEIPRYAEYHDYNIIVVENVVEARKWRSWDSWIFWMSNLGYDHKVVYFNSMFAWPTPQSRDRMYVVFWKKGNPAPDLDFRPPAWCEQCETPVEAIQSWKNPQRKWGKWGKYDMRGNSSGQYVYRCPNCAEVVIPFYYCAANCIDWSDVGERIGDRGRPLRKRTLDRIRHGLEMYRDQAMLFGTGPQPDLLAAWMVDLSRSHGHDRRSNPVTAALVSQTTAQTLGLASYPMMVETSYPGDRKVSAADRPMPTQTARQSMGMAMVPGMLASLRGPQTAQSAGAPIGAQVASATNHALVHFPIHIGYANGDSPARAVDEPLKTQHTSNSNGVVFPPFVAELFGSSNHRPVAKPIGAMTAQGGNYGVVSPPPFLMSYYGTADGGKDVHQPVGAVTALDRHALVNSGQPAVEDCHFRMLRPDEIKSAMAFGDEYIVLGNKGQQVRQLGNAVTPPVMQMILERCLATFE